MRFSRIGKLVASDLAGCLAAILLALLGAIADNPLGVFFGIWLSLFFILRGGSRRAALAIAVCSSVLAALPWLGFGGGSFGVPGYEISLPTLEWPDSVFRGHNTNCGKPGKLSVDLENPDYQVDQNRYCVAGITKQRGKPHPKT